MDDLDTFLDGNSSSVTDEEMAAFLDEGLPPEPHIRDAIREADRAGSVESFASGVAQGLSFGFDDEIIGGLQALPSLVIPGRSFGEDYQKNRDAIRTYNKRIMENRPITNMLGDIGSSVVGGGAAVKGAMKGARAAREAQALKKMSPNDLDDLSLIDDISGKPAGTALKDQSIRAIDPLIGGAVGGGAAGAARGAGENEQPGALLEDTVQGGLWGGALGGITGGIGAGVGKLSDHATDLLEKYVPPAKSQIADFFANLEGLDDDLVRKMSLIYDANPAMFEKMISGVLPSIGGISVGGARMANNAARKLSGWMENSGVLGGIGVGAGSASANPRDESDDFLDRKPGQDEIDSYLRQPESLMPKLSGTPYESILGDALNRGQEAARAQLYSLMFRPEFRRLLGLG